MMARKEAELIAVNEQINTLASQLQTAQLEKKEAIAKSETKFDVCLHLL
jgi:hypothetical protein